MQGLVQGDLPISERLQTHLDHCLSCGLCESVCPAKVDYSYLIDSTRQWLQQQPATKSPRLLQRLLHWLIQKPRRMRLLHRVLYYYQQSGLLNIFKKRLNLLTRLHAYLPTLARPTDWHVDYPTQIIPKQGRVGLFQGCMQSLCDQKTLQDSIDLLNRLGVGVYLPKQQHCCGALALHSGMPKETAHNAACNSHLFNQHALDAIISTTPGCTIVMKHYQQHPGIQAPVSFNAPLLDIHEFISRLDWSGVRFAKTHYTVAIHTPCTESALFKTEIIRELLQKIPGITLIPLHPKPTCCGAAGSYMFDNPEMADALCSKLFSNLAQTPDVIVSSNLGCLLHLRTYLQKNVIHISVQHPISLLVEHMV